MISWKQCVSTLAVVFSATLLNAQPTGFSDGFSDASLQGWRAEGERAWTVQSGKVKPNDGGNAGFLIGRYPCSDNGRIEVDMNADQWNGQEGGVVVRWTSAASFYYIGVKPGNQWSNAVYLCKNTTNCASGKVLAQNFSLSAQFHLAVEVHQATIKVFINNVLRGIYTDPSAPLMNGYAGLGHSSAWNSWIDFDNFSWTDESGSASTIVPTNTTAAIKPGDIVVYFKDEGLSENNIMKPRWYVENKGTVPVSGFQVYFYLTVAAGKTPVLEDYYTPDCAVSLARISDTKYRITMDYAGTTLYPGSVTPDRSGDVIGIHYSDWAVMDKGNSFSYTPTAGFVPVTNMPVIVPAAGPAGAPVAGTVPPVTLKTKKLRLLNLHCTETEDVAGEDEGLLEVYRDGQIVSSFTHDLNDGQDWAVNQEFTLSGNMDVRLTDIDGDIWGDDNDFLGSVVVNTDLGVHQGTYNADGANYTLTYEIIENSTVVPGTKQVTVTSLTINTLYCAETEDWTGADEDLLYVIIDGKQAAELQHDLNNGQTWTINAKFEVNSTATLHLYDQDSPDDDDDLGTVTADLTPGTHTGKFTQDGADYTITYTISSTTKTVLAKTDQEIALDAFKASTKTGVWSKITKAALVKDIEEKLNGELPEQHDSPICGAASIIYELVKRNPLRYVELCQKIYEDASFKSRTKTYTVDLDEDVLSAQYHSSFNGDEADWMFMAFLRDEGNAIFDVDPDGSTQIYGISTPWEVSEWTYEILGFPTTDVTTTFLWGEMDALDRARDVVQNHGGVAFFLIDASLAEHQGTTLNYPNHWVVLVGDVSIDWGKWYSWDSGHVKFTIFTWGDDKVKIDLSEGDFEDAFFGCVTGQ